MGQLQGNSRPLSGAGRWDRFAIPIAYEWKTADETPKYLDKTVMCLRLSCRLPFRTSEIVDIGILTSAASFDCFTRHPRSSSRN
jgi:hypothetical protein